jgi:hypothetical protein
MKDETAPPTPMLFSHPDEDSPSSGHDRPARHPVGNLFSEPSSAPPAPAQSDEYPQRIRKPTRQARR